MRFWQSYGCRYRKSRTAGTLNLRAFHSLGVEVVKFILEQDPGNVPIVQKWIDKWFWRGYRLLTLVAMMMDYMLPKRVMSWQEAWEMYFEKNAMALFNDLERYGIRKPKYYEVATKEKDRLSH